MMRRPQHVHHLLFPNGTIINTKGIFRWGSTEVSIYHKEGVEVIVPEELKQHSSVHFNPLETSLINATETVQEDLEDLLVEEMLVCVNLDDCNPILAQAALMSLYQNRLAFQARSR